VKPVLDLVNGKTVALVGNATSVLANGDAIDSYDVVIRMNMGVPGVLPQQVIGKRTTIWATAKRYDSIECDCELLLFMKLTPLGDKHWQQLLNNALDNYRYRLWRWPQTLENEATAFVGHSPSTGIRLLWWLKTKAKPKLVMPFHFDGWRTPTNYSGKMNTPSHSPEHEREAYKRLMLGDFTSEHA
jgi:hypothetical protein